MKGKAISIMAVLILMACMAATAGSDFASAKVTDVTVSETDVCSYGVVKEKYTEYYDHDTDRLATNSQKDRSIYAYIPGSEDEASFLKFVETKGADGDIPISNYTDIRNASIYRFTDSEETYRMYSYGLESYQNLEVLSYGYFAAFKIVDSTTVSVDAGSSSMYLTNDDSSYNVSAGASREIKLYEGDKYLVLVASPAFDSGSITGPAYIKSTYLCNVSYTIGNVDVSDGEGGTGALYLAYGLVGICVFFFLIKIIWKKQPGWARKQPKWSKH